MYYKTRVLPVSPGITADWRVNPNSGLSYENLMAKDPELSGFLSQGGILGVHTKALANSHNVYAFSKVHQGVQYFSSSENPKPAWNDCCNQKAYLACLPFTVSQKYLLPDGYGQRWLYTFLTRLPFYSGSIAKMPDLGSFSDYDGASRRAWWAMQPKFEGEISMLNFIFELKDFRRLAKSLVGLRSPALIAQKMRNLQHKLRRYLWETRSASVPRNGLGTLKDALSLASQARLSSEFAIKPLIKDLATILYQSGTIVRDAQERFSSQGEDVQTRHYSETNELNENVISYGNKYNLHYMLAHREIETFTASMDFTYKYSMRNDSDAFLRFWGLQGTYEALWNMIPFSFVVDYFAQVGKAIKYMSVDPNVKLVPLNYCESLARVYSSGYVATGDSRAFIACNGKSFLPRGTLLTGFHGSTYQRKLCSPNKGAALPRLKLPSGSQGINMAALVYSFLR